MQLRLILCCQPENWRLMRLRNLIPMKSKLILFKSAILPYLTYCHLVWHFFCKASDTQKLERLQERGLRAVTALEVRTCEFEGASTRSKRRPLLFTGITLFPR